MKVAHLTTVDSSLRYLLLAQLSAALEAGHEVIGISAPGPDVEYLEKVGIRHVPLPSSTRSMNLKADAKAAARLWRILRSERPDVLHTHNPKPGLYGRVLGRMAGVPMVVNTVHGLYATERDPWLKRTFVYAAEVIAAWFSNAELIQNPEDLALLGRLPLYPRSRAALLGNGVDVRRFDPDRFADEERAAVRSSLGLPSDSVVVGCVGRLVREKGFLELFAAAQLTKANVTLLVVGPEDPQKGDALPTRAIEEARQAGVVFAGHREDIDRIYLAMDIFVLASHREGFPRAAMEAAAMGLPVVATDIRGCRQVVASGETGLLVPPGNAKELACALDALAIDARLRADMGHAARQRAERLFDEGDVVEKVLAVYDRKSRARTNRRAARAVKRAVDLVGAVVLLVVTLPVLAAVAALVRLRLGTPIIFTQVRPGKDGRPFTIYKFRTMRAPSFEGEPDQARLNRLGRALRATSLDELPELINVLRGEMSLVGPRPLLMEYLDRYSPRQARRHEVKPGITGWGQINGRNALSWDAKLEMDVWYVENWGLALDLRILAATAGAVVKRSGINHAGHATMPIFVPPTNAPEARGAPDPLGDRPEHRGCPSE